MEEVHHESWTKLFLWNVLMRRGCRERERESEREREREGEREERERDGMKDGRRKQK